MRFYRVYVIDAADSIAQTRFIEAASDDEAKRLARVDVRDDVAVEIWDQNRLVAHLARPSEAAVVAEAAQFDVTNNLHSGTLARSAQSSAALH